MDGPSWWTALRTRAWTVVDAVDRRVPLHLSQLARRIADRDLLTSASSLAFYGLVSALPLLLIAFALMSAVAGEETVQRFAQQVSRSGPEGTGRFVDQMASSGGSLTLATLVFTIWPATAYGGGLRRTLARHSDDDGGRAPGLQGRLLGLSLVPALPVLVLAGLPLMFFLSTLSGDGPAATAAGWTLALVAGTAIGTLVTTLLYHGFSPGDLGWRESVRGAALAAFVTGIFSLLFVIYLEVGNTGDRFGGGTIAVVVLLGVWLFVANILLLAGFETVAQLHDAADATPDMGGVHGTAMEPLPEVDLPTTDSQDPEDDDPDADAPERDPSPSPDAPATPSPTEPTPRPPTAEATTTEPQPSPRPTSTGQDPSPPTGPGDPSDSESASESESDDGGLLPW